MSTGRIWKQACRVGLAVASATLGSAATADDSRSPVEAYFEHLWTQAAYAACAATAFKGEDAEIFCFGEDPYGQPLTENTQFQLASVSKHFTAVLALKLAERGIVRLDDPIVERLPELSNFSSVTLRQLLNNTAGVPNHDQFPAYVAGRDGPIADANLLSLINDAGPRFEAGSAYEYSNFGWRLAAILLHRADGRSFRELTQDELFEPLGMSDTVAVDGSDYARHPGLEPFGADGFVATLSAHPQWNEGAGTIVSTPRNMISWLRALHSGRVLSDESYAALTTADDNGYSMGFAIYEASGEKIVAHDGRFVGGSADVQHRSPSGFVSVVLSHQNTRLTQATRSDLSRFSRGEDMQNPLGELAPVTVEVEDSDAWKLQGTYEFGPGFFVIVRAVGDRLYVAANWGDYTELLPVADGAYVSRTLGARITFSETDAGVPALSWDGSPPIPRTP